MMTKLLMTDEDIYSQEYFESVDQDAKRSAEAVVASILRDYAPKTVLDVGCGTGAMLVELAAKGVVGTGLEGSEAALGYCRNRGLSVHKYDLESSFPPPIPAHFDVVISMEVAEHLPQRSADRFVSLLTSHGETVVFTAATPGQGGRDHVNEQPHEYWVDKFVQRGFEYAVQRSLDWRGEWERQETASWYFRNLMLFQAKPTTPASGAAVPKGDDVRSGRTPN